MNNTNLKYFENARIINNGYFYSFEYFSSNNSIGFDPNPFIYCIGPSLKNKNNFVGLNLHHLPISERKIFIKNMQKSFDFINDEDRHYLSEYSVLQMLPGAKYAIREYNRNRIYKPIKIFNFAVPLFLESQMSPYLQTIDMSNVDYSLIANKLRN